MKSIALIVSMLLMSGCYQSQRASIDQSFDRQTEMFTAECEDHEDSLRCTRTRQWLQDKHDQEVKTDRENVAAGEAIGAVVLIGVVAIMVVSFGAQR
jgi:hypothetical protein